MANPVLETLIEDTDPYVMAAQDDDGTTVADLIIETQREPDGEPVDMLDHAAKARDIADQLDDLADKADDLADEDDRYSQAALESYQREFKTIMSAHGLRYKPTRCEASVESKDRRIGFVDDARFAAKDLRVNADMIDGFSAEGLILDLFKDKDAAIKKATIVLQRTIPALRDVAKTAKNEGLLLAHSGIAKFLTKRDNDVLSFPDAINDEELYFKSCLNYISDRVSVLKELQISDQEVKPGDERVVNTGKSNSKNTPDAYSLLGNYGVFDFKLVERKGWVNRKIGAAGTIVAFLLGGVAGAVGYGHGQNKIIVYGSIAISALSLNPILVGVAAARNEIADWIRDKRLNASDVNTVISVEDMETALRKVLDFDTYAKTTQLYVELDQVDRHLATLRSNKELYKEAMVEVRKIKDTLAVMKERVFYLITETARLTELITGN